MSTHLKQRLLTVREYHRMAETGILSPEERVELLNGQIIHMSPIGSRHAACVEKLGGLLKQSLGEKAMVRTQNPVTLSERSEPEPDLAIVRYRENYYADRHPLPPEIYLLVEVAESSLEKDRESKRPIYARAGIPEYWIIDLDRQVIEICRSPEGDQYRSKTVRRSGEVIELEDLEITIPVEAFLV